MDELIKEHNDYKSTEMISLNRLNYMKEISKTLIINLNTIDQPSLKYLLSSHYSPIQELLYNRYFLELFNHFILDDFLDQLLSNLPTSSSILSLTSIIKSSKDTNKISKSKFVLSNLLLKPNGIQSLLQLSLKSDEFNQQKINFLAKMLSTKPTNMIDDTYIELLIKNLLHTTLFDPPTTHLKVISNTIDLLQLKSPSSTNYYLDLHILNPFFQLDNPSAITNALLYIKHLNIHSKLTLDNYTNRLLPILFNLAQHLNNSKTVNPDFKLILDEIFASWSTHISKENAVNSIWSTLNSNNGWNDDSLEWSSSNPDGLQIIKKSSSSTNKPNLFNISQHEQNDLFEITPNPQLLATFVINIHRKEISSNILIKCLSQYHGLEDFSNYEMLNIKEILKYLQFSTALIEQMGSTVLDNKDEILGFIYHTLQIQQSSTTNETETLNRPAKGLQDLLIFETQNDTVESDTDEHLQSVDQILISTALSLLLAILEANSHLNVDNTPLLALINQKLDIFIDQFPAISPVANECKLVLLARNVTTSEMMPSNSAYKEQHEIYQQSLKEIQDPSLPVKAHGLDQLRKLVESTASKNLIIPYDQLTLDETLIDGILDVFIQAIKADDSYIYLNAVRGLVIMMDKIGHEIIAELSKRYSINKTSITEIELDQRLRIGEAIIQVFQRLSNALPSYTHLILPQLINVMSNNDFPALLRASSITILSEACSTCIKAIEPYIFEVLDGIRDLLVIESSKSSKDLDNPLDKDTKLVQLKRSALIFLARFFRENRRDRGVYIPSDLKSSIITNVKYISESDNDDLVKHQAMELIDEFGWSNKLL
ncbi:hypothetical protein E3Q13_02664 [Wallemia mellicola]|nr:hypothetical protein E3Q13_02664 [Wallemia mellicola]